MLLQLGIVEPRTLNRGWMKFSFLTVDDVPHSNQLIVPSRARHQKPIASDRVDEIRHVANLHRRNQLRNKIGSVHNGQIDLRAARFLPSCQAVNDGLVLGLIKPLGPPDGYGFGGFYGSGTRGGDGGDGTKTSDGTTTR